MTRLALPETYVGLPDEIVAEQDWKDVLREHAAQVQRNFEKIARVWIPAEPWRVVGASGQPAFENGWVNFNAGYDTAAFYRQGDRVYLRGLVKNGSLTSTIFTLPTGYRPPLHLLFPGDSQNTECTLRVESGGAVVLAANGSAVYLSLSNVNFRVV